MYIEIKGEFNMEKKVKLFQIVELNTFIKKLENEKLPFSLAHKLYSLHNATQKDVEFYYNKLQELLDTYADRDENGKVKMSQDGAQIILKQDKVEDCQKKMNELSGCEIDLVFTPLKVEDLDMVEGLNITLNELIALNPFLDE